MTAPIYDKLKKYSSHGIYPFHMPGHKGGRKGIFPQVLPMDITEIDGFDNLHQPTGIIAQAQAMAAKTFGAEESFFMVNGSTGGILAAILSACKDGEEVLVARNCHRSVYSAIALSGAKPIYIQPGIVDATVAGGISPDVVEKLLEEHPKIRLIVLTSPTYEGFTSDIEAISRIVHKKAERILVVDEAHGAYMKFHSYFPKTALEQGADLVIQSLHKTLPSPTQTAILHMQGNRVNKTLLKQCISMVETFSPSYLFLAAMDQCRQWLDTEGKQAFSDYVGKLEQFRKEVEGLKQIRLWGKELCGVANIHDVDLGKLVFYLPFSQWSGERLGRHLLEQYGLQMELCSISHVVAMTSPADTEDGFIRLAKALKEIEKEMAVSNLRNNENLSSLPLPEVEMTPRQAFFAEKEEVSLQLSVGEVCGEFIIPYPPGIPLLVPGERISKEILEHILNYKAEKHPIVGCADDTLEKITVVKRRKTGVE